MKNNVFRFISFTFSLLLFLNSTALFCGEIIRDREIIELKPSGQCRINVKIPFGNILAENSSSGILKAELEKSLETSNTEKGMKILKNVKLSFSESSRKIDLYVKKSRSLKKTDSLNLYLSIPEGHELDFETGGGSVRIRNHKGSISARTSGGNITAGNVSGGSVKLFTSGGNINIGNISDGGCRAVTKGGSIITGDIKDKAVLETEGGNITAGFSEDSIIADSSGGNISIAGCRGTAELSTKGGNILAGSAGKKLKAKTKGGNIVVEDTGQNAELLTYGGNITVNNINRNISAESFGGSISATVGRKADKKAKDISLLTKGGDITVSIPGSFSFNLDAEINLSKSKHGNYSINSDFPVDITRDNPEKTKKITAKGDFSGSSTDIKLSTKNSSIYIIKY